MPILKNCEWCHAEFSVRPAKQFQRFCSIACQRNKRISCHADLTCINCGTGFHVSRKRELSRKFCSTQCQRVHEGVNGRPAALVDVTEFKCQECGKPFYYKPAYLTEYRKKYDKDPSYCSLQCFHTARKRGFDEATDIKCIQCGGPMPTRTESGYLKRQNGLCSTACRSMFRRLSYQAKHQGQEPTKRIVRNGYVRMIIPGTDGSSPRETLEHRYIMEKNIGRPLLTEETVHHINGNRQDNRIDNLELFSSRHGPGQRVLDKVVFALEIQEAYPEFIDEAREVIRKKRQE